MFFSPPLYMFAIKMFKDLVMMAQVKPALRRLMPVDRQFEVSLGYTVRPNERINKLKFKDMDCSLKYPKVGSV